ncbi:unnamed protein product [Peronospora destructor]|uniref:ER membrane protein complex subunit 1 n=1 Tax=Peronospora destructor TaxID=86335 RepID=A0AAV0VFH7_9STRA|nr:unnamed protein product [Peronospora destructor]
MLLLLQRLLLLTTALCLALGNALYADQAGQFDWSTENLGRVHAVVFGGSVFGDSTRALYVASDDNSKALARLDSKTGEIHWRCVFSDGDAINDIQLTIYGLLSVSGTGHNVRLWDLNSGVLLWDDVTDVGPAQQNTVFGGLFALDEDHSVVLTSTSVTMVSVKDRQVKVQTLPQDFTKAAVEAAELSWQVGSDKATLFVMAGNHVLHFDLASSRVVDHSTGSEVEDKDKSDVIATTVLRRDNDEGKVVAVTLTRDQLLLQGLENKNDAIEIPFAFLKLEDDKVVAIDASIASSLVVELTSGKRAVLKISSALSVEVVAVVAAEGALMKSATDDLVLFHAAAKSSKNVQITSYIFSKSLIFVSWDVELDMASFGGDISRVFVECLPTKKDSIPSCHAVLVLKDDALIMTSNGNEAGAANNGSVQWLREESLANIKCVRWITPAETEIEKQALKRIPSFIEEVKIEIKHLQQLIQKIMSFSSTLFDESTRQRGVDRSRAARKEPPNAHLFGFSKYIMVLTASGKLFAIRAEASTVAWSLFVGPEYQLFVTRDHPALGSGAELLLVSNSTELVWLNGDDGHQLDAASASESAPWVVILPKRKHLASDKEPIARRMVAVISENSLRVSLYPKDTADATHPELEHFYFYRYDKSAKALHGYLITNNGDANSVDYRAREVWSIVLTREEQVIAMSHHHDHYVVDSAVTITGDDSLLIKYLNPNLFGLATIATEGNNEATSVLYVSLIDSVAGRIIHRVRHSHATGPVRMVQSENWLVYSYWNYKEKRTELVSLSLFDGAVGMHSLNLWKRPSWTSTRSSFDPKAPFVLQKSFIYPTKITSLGVTVTAHGITPQSILIGMETGQIFKLARNFIDPRQPERQLTPEEQAEGLMMYSPLLPVYSRPQAMLTYNRTVENLKSISTASAELESTTLVFAHGLDMFYVRMAPVKAFDLLPSDFNHEMLILLCVAFLVVTFLTKALAQRKALQTAWK